MELKKHILVAPLNWGLGHATRCIPIINALIEYDFIPILASDGMALDLLRIEFPELKAIELPSYNIRYSKKGKSLKVKLLIDSPRMLKAIKEEKKLVKKLVAENEIHGIISDNRYGVYNNTIPSVFITHQLNVLSGNTSWFSSKLHQQIIKKFDECWIPDVQHEPSLSGKLGHAKQNDLKLKYLGSLSRFNKADANITNDLMVLLSGPEPQRTILEKKLLEDLNNFKGSIIFVQGVVENVQTKLKRGNMTIFNFMKSGQLEKTINSSHIILSRSGYTTIMDLAKLE
ncbi:MAG: glycosyltransferase, partial [Flavobacteriaceae bacterium]|nr:glycosyltransferase [Flavobacteriaceae bacterium]